MVDAVQLWPLVRSTVRSPGVPEIVAYGPMIGGLIQNPPTPEDQGLTSIENLYVSLVDPASTIESGTTYLVPPGSFFTIPPGNIRNVYVNAPSGGHRFSGVAIYEAPNFTEASDQFGPTGPVTLTNVIPSYLYVQYADDDDLQAFVRAYNEMAQQYVTWFATISLPVYTSNTINSALLDWVAEGLYGMKRPVLPSGLSQNLGMLNTIQLNTLPLNVEELLGPPDYYLVDDDVFKRILTWHLYKGDGKLFDIRWLKRRVMRFLTGINGGQGETDQTYQISISFGVDGEVNINLQSIQRFATGGALLGFGLMNDFQLNELETDYVVVPISPVAPIFKAAVESGVLELPFQYTWIVNIN